MILIRLSAATLGKETYVATFEWNYKSRERTAYKTLLLR